MVLPIANFEWENREPPPTEFQVFSVRKLFPEAVEVAFNHNMNSYLRSAKLTIFPLGSIEPSGVEFSFHSINPAEYISVLFVGSPNEYSIHYKYSESSTDSKLEELDLSAIPFDSLEALNILNDNGQILWKYPDIIFPIDLVLEFPLRGDDLNPQWKATYLREGFGLLGPSAILMMDLENNSIEVITEED